MPENTISVPVSIKQFLQIVDYVRARGGMRDPVDIVGDAIDQWIGNADLFADEDILGIPTHGYAWKQLFLPSGTKIRMTYKGTTYHAEIVGDEFIGIDSKKMSPSEFANTVADGTARNAWRDLWIKRPSDYAFRLADELRRQV